MPRRARPRSNHRRALQAPATTARCRTSCDRLPHAFPSRFTPPATARPAILRATCWCRVAYLLQSAPSPRMKTSMRFSASQGVPASPSARSGDKHSQVSRKWSGRSTWTPQAIPSNHSCQPATAPRRPRRWCQPNRPPPRLRLISKSKPPHLLRHLHLPQAPAQATRLASFFEGKRPVATAFTGAAQRPRRRTLRPWPRCVAIFL